MPEARRHARRITRHGASARAKQLTAQQSCRELVQAAETRVARASALPSRRRRANCAARDVRSAREIRSAIVLAVQRAAAAHRRCARSGSSAPESRTRHVAIPNVAADCVPARSATAGWCTSAGVLHLVGANATGAGRMQHVDVGNVTEWRPHPVDDEPWSMSGRFDVFPLYVTTAPADAAASANASSSAVSAANADRKNCERETGRRRTSHTRSGTRTFQRPREAVVSRSTNKAAVADQPAHCRPPGGRVSAHAVRWRQCIGHRDVAVTMSRRISAIDDEKPMRADSRQVPSRISAASGRSLRTLRAG